jgi:hypothetical protein
MDRGYEELSRLDEEGEARQLARLRDKVGCTGAGLGWAGAVGY